MSAAMFERRLIRFLTELDHLHRHANWETRNAAAEDEQRAPSSSRRYVASSSAHWRKPD